MVIRGQGVVVAELAELELLVAAVAERLCAASHAEVPMECWVRDGKMGVDCNMQAGLKEPPLHNTRQSEPKAYDEARCESEMSL